MAALALEMLAGLALVIVGGALIIRELRKPAPRRNMALVYTAMMPVAVGVAMSMHVGLIVFSSMLA